MPVTVSRLLTSARKRRKFTQSQIAALCHVAQPTVAGWESKERPKLPRPARWRAVSDAYGITVGALAAAVMGAR